MNITPDFFAQIAGGRAQAYLASGQLELAIKWQEDVVRRKPEDAGAWKALAGIYEQAGRTELAAQAQQRARASSQRPRE
ncbi:MAG: tetratricopeptide repeat protein [Terriglobales bacterium]